MRGYSEYKEYHGVQYPSQWQCSVFKRFCTLISGNSNVEELTHGEIPFIRVSDMNLPQNAKVITTSTAFVKRYGNERNIFPIGSVIFPKRGGAILTNKRRIVAIDVCCDLNIMGAIPCKKVVPEYLYYYLLSKDFSLLVDGSAIPQINKGDIEPLVFTLPSLAEQQHIVSFLDEKTAKIDEYIDKKNKEIEALKEWKKALIAHVVTKGLNTNAKMKDSGVSWIGEIPEHWELRRAKYMFKKHKRPVRDTDEVITCFRDGEVTLRKNRRTTGFTESLTEVGYQGIRKGDLVIHQMDAFAGAIGISDSDGKGTSVYHCCTSVGNAYTRFYLYVIRQMAYSGFIQSLYRGIRERSSDFNFQVFGNQFLYIPPIEEQQEIVEYIDAATTKADKMIVELANHVESMKEYKQRLIADVVTGKINVQP